MRVVMAASEAVPLAKTGGLADVAGALPRALRALGVDVSIIVPKYGPPHGSATPAVPTGWTVEAPVSNKIVGAPVWQTTLEGGVPVFLIEADQYFGRPGLYGTPEGDYLDNAERFAFFSRAVAALLGHLGAPNILHCHDWQTALVPAFLRFDGVRYPHLGRVRSVLTVHNIGYQGVFWQHDWHLLNLDWRHFTPEALEFYGQINYLKGGLASADMLTTVSPTYAREIQTAEYGSGLEGVLQARRAALVGILNGVDYTEWNPEHDQEIVARYSATAIEGKARCKADLQASLGLPLDPDVPVLGVVSRLTGQKGSDLLAEVLPRLLNKRVQIVVLGSGEAQYQDRMQNLARAFRQRLAARIRFDPKLAHKIEAGSDLFLMPSRYEPCGLNQVYSLRYGTIPVVRATGGLQDTIIDFDADRGRATGFKFQEYSSRAFLAAVERALQIYRRPRQWRGLMRNAMAAEFSWEKSARDYIALYEAMVGAR